MPKPPALNLRQARFAEAYVRHRNGSRAAREAGYSAAGRSANATARRLLAHARVKERILALEADTDSALQYDKALVLNGLRDMAEIAKEKRKPNVMISAWREIGKLYGFYPPKTGKAGKVKQPRKEVLTAKQRALQKKVESMTDAQLLAIIEKGESAAS